MKNNFQTSIVVKKPISKVFDTISNGIELWWSTDFEGRADSIGAVFSVRFGNTFKTMRIDSIQRNQQITWQCIDQFLEMPEGMKQLKNPKEWVGNKLIWNFNEIAGTTTLNFIHEGLTPEVECWGVCEQGWDQTFISLKNLLLKGKGNPFVKLDPQHLQKAKDYDSEISDL